MSNSKLTKQGQIVSMNCRILLLQYKPKLGCTKPSTGPVVGHRWLKSRPMCLAIAGGQPVRDQEPHFLLCYSKEPHHVHYTWAHMNIQ